MAWETTAFENGKNFRYKIYLFRLGSAVWLIAVGRTGWRWLQIASRAQCGYHTRRQYQSGSVADHVVNIHWSIGISEPDNIGNYEAATSDCRFENARVRGSGALPCYPPTIEGTIS